MTNQKPDPFFRNLLIGAPLITTLGIATLLGCSPTPEGATPVTSKPATTAEKEAPEPVSNEWKTEEFVDEASGKTGVKTVGVSENTVNLDFPYGGAQHGTLIVRSHPRHGNDLMFRLREGQITCRSYGDDHEYILARFDDSPVEKFKCTAADDVGTTNVVFVPDYMDSSGGYAKYSPSGDNDMDRFLRKLRASNTAWVTVPIYGNGQQTFRFDSSGY